MYINLVRASNFCSQGKSSRLRGTGFTSSKDNSMRPSPRVLSYRLDSSEIFSWFILPLPWWVHPAVLAPTHTQPWIGLSSEHVFVRSRHREPVSCVLADIIFWPQALSSQNIQYREVYLLMQRMTSVRITEEKENRHASVSFWWPLTGLASLDAIYYASMIYPFEDYREHSSLILINDTHMHMHMHMLIIIYPRRFFFS